MKRPNFIYIVLIFLMISTLFTGCAASDVKDESKNLTTADNSDVLDIVTNGANDFAFRLSSALAEQNENINFICSPYSVWVPLAALVNATDSQNKDKLLEVLGVTGVSEADINTASAQMLYELTNQREKEYNEYRSPLSLANAIFVDDKVTLKKGFAQTFADYYKGVAMNVNFNSPEAVDTVNKWASKNTNGLISSIVDEFEPNTIATFTSAIYFSDRWLEEFNPEVTKEDVFYSPTGETKAFFMLLKSDDYSYYEDENVQAIRLLFKEFSSMYIIMPKDGNATELFTSMTGEYFEKIGKGTKESTGTLLLPRFSIESGEIKLKDTLTSLGVPLFNKVTAPLTSGLIEEDLPVCLLESFHKAAIEVDEEGATAAAVTAFNGGILGIPEPTEPFEMICDKPFTFVIEGYDQILFTGIVNQP